MASKGSTNVEGTCIEGPYFLFKIENYNSRQLPVGSCITSPNYPRPNGDMPDEEQHNVSLFLRLKSEIVKDVAAKYCFELLDKHGRFFNACSSETDTFTSSRKSVGFIEFYSRYLLEQRYCVDNTIVISCAIEVLTLITDVQTYPGGLCEHMGKLWERGDKFDVIFEVEGESNPAHRLILAARSPVFEARLYGSMAEAKMTHIKIEEMKADVFKALLHFIYTDQIATDGSSDHQPISVELCQGLVVAADRYALGRLSCLCEEQLAGSFSVDTVATTLLLADRHSHAGLKRKCLDFASDPANFSLVALTDAYLQIKKEAPALFAELSEKVKSCMKDFVKRQRTFY